VRLDFSSAKSKAIASIQQRDYPFAKQIETEMAAYAAFKHVELYNVGKAKKR